MAVRTKQLVLGNPVGTNSTLYECPSGETTILKSVFFRVRVAGPVNVTLRINHLALNYDLFSWNGLTLGQSVNAELWVVMIPTDKLRFLTTVADAISLVVSGTELEGIAD